MSSTLRPSVALPLLLLLLVVIGSPPALAQEATPTALEELPTTTLLDVPLESLPEPPALVGLARLVFPSGTTLLGGPINGPRLFFVETGSFAIRLDSKGTLWRNNDESTAMPVEEGASITLADNDLLIVLDSPPFEITNIETSPSVMLDIVIWPAIEQTIRPFITEAGVIFEPLLVASISELPEAPARLLLQETSLPRDGAMAVAPESGPVMFYVDTGILGAKLESGTLVYASAASNNPGSMGGRLKTLAPGSEALLTAGGTAIFQGSSDGVGRNLGRTPLELLLLQIVPVDSETG